MQQNCVQSNDAQANNKILLWLNQNELFFPSLACVCCVCSVHLSNLYFGAIFLSASIKLCKLKRIKRPIVVEWRRRWRWKEWKKRKGTVRVYWKDYGDQETNTFDSSCVFFFLRPLVQMVRNILLFQRYTITNDNAE